MDKVFRSHNPVLSWRVRDLAWAAVNLAQGMALLIWLALGISVSLLLILITRRQDLALTIAGKFWAPVVLRGAGARVLIEGAENVDWSRPHVFMMNHRSLIDIPVAMSVLRTPLRFVAKSSLRHIPFLGWYVSATGMFFLGRGRGSLPLTVLRRAVRKIRSGQSVLLFPEGTRSRDGSLLPFHRGSFAIPFRAGVPILPIAVLGASAALPPDGFRVRPGVVRVRIGLPVSTTVASPEGRDRIVEQVRQQIDELLHAGEDAGRVRPARCLDRERREA